MRNGEDDTDALFVDFYKQRTDGVSQRYQVLQENLIGAMQTVRFRLGSKRKYFHFDYRPTTPKNYQHQNREV